MTFPTISYKFNDIESAKLLTDVIEQKFTSLAKLLPASATSTCQVEFEKTAIHHHGRVYRVEVNLRVNGTLHRAEAIEHTFEEAIAKVRDELDQELSQAKDRKNSLVRRAGRAFKQLLSRG